MAITLASIVSDVRLLSGLRSNQLYTDTDIQGLVSDLWLEIYDRFVTTNQHYSITSVEFTLAGGTGSGSSFDLPSNFQLGNGLELNPTYPRPQSVRYLDNWLSRNNLGASVLNMGGDGLTCADRQYCFTNNQLMVFPTTNSQGNYRLWYTPMAKTLAPQITRTFAIVGINDFAQVLTNPEFPTATGEWTLTNAGLTTDIPIDGSVSLNLDLGVPNATFDGPWTVVGMTSPRFQSPLTSTYDEMWVSNLASTSGLTGPLTGTGTYTYQPIGTLDALPDYADPWAIYLKLGASIAIREAREQDCTDLERRFAAQKLRVDTVLQNRQEEATQPPLNSGRGFWDSL